MPTHLARRINNFDLPKDTCPFLFCMGEAVANGIHAILLNEDKLGKIDIKIDVQFNSNEINKFLVNSFTVEDNGVGFNDDNFEAFKTPDISGKDKEAKFSAKGLGRLLYLRVFDEVAISSTYYCNEKGWQKRDFIFNKDWQGVSDFTVAPSYTSNSKTSLIFTNANTDIHLEPLTKEMMVAFLKEHFFITFISARDEYKRNIEFTITITDDKRKLEEKFDINTVLGQYDITKKELSFDDKVNAITLYHIEYAADSANNIFYYQLKNKQYIHRIIYCAGLRALKNSPVEEFSQKPYRKDDGVEYNYIAYVKSTILDKASNSNRDELQNFKHKKEFIELVNSVISEHLNPIIVKMTKEKEDRTLKILSQFSVYDYLKDELLEVVGFDDDEAQIQMKMYDQHAKKRLQFRKNMLEEGRRLDLGQTTDLLEKVNMAAVVDLAEYMAVRKFVIDKLEKIVGVAKKDKRSGETELHELFLPKDRASDTNKIRLGYDSHHLWLFDDRFMFYEDAFSDVKMKTIIKERFPNVIINDISFNNKEPDILLSFRSPNDRGNNLVFIELKGVGDTHLEKNTGINQLFERVSSVKDIKEQLSEIEGYKINEVWYYLITELNDEYIKHLINDDYKSLYSSDKGIYYRYYQKLDVNAYVISYSSLLNDAKLRHQAFFSLLGVQ